MMFDWTTTTLPTWPSPRFVEHDRTDDFENPRRGSRAQAAAAAAIAIGLVLGGLAWAWWRRRQAAVASVPAPVAHATIPVAEPAPAPARVWVPQTWAEIQRMLRGVGAWIRLAPHTDDHQLAQTIWAAFWGDAPFPRLGSDDPRPGVGEALDVVFEVIAMARAEYNSQSVSAEPVPTSEEPTEQLDTADASVCDSPTPGSFYRVQRGDDLLGDGGIAARALCTAVLDAAQRRGRAPEKAQGRAERLASDPRAQATYADLIQRGAWNGQHGDELVEGALLWLPPLHRVRLLDRSRQRRVSADPEPWPDGSSKLEPPPMVRESKCRLSWWPEDRRRRAIADDRQLGLAGVGMCEIALHTGRSPHFVP